MPRRTGRSWGGGGAAQPIRKPNLGGAGAGVAAGLGGLLSYIVGKAPELQERILSNPLDSAPSISLLPTPSSRRTGPTVTSTPAENKNKISITGFPGTERGRGEGFLINPSNNQKTAQDNIVSFDLESALKRKESVVGSSGTKRSGYGQIINQAQKRHAQRVLRDVGPDVKVNMPPVKEGALWLDQYMENPANQAYINKTQEGLIESLLGSPEAAGLFGIFGHAPGKSIKQIQEETGQNAPDHIVSGELNSLERQMRDRGANPSTYKEVVEWHIKNNPKYKGFTMQDMIKQVGLPTRYWE